jgi:ATP-binding cassette subfamily C protein
MLIRELHLSQLTDKVIAKFFGLRTELARIKAVTSFLPNINKFVFEIIILLCGVLIAAAQYLRGTPENTLVALSIFLAAASRAVPSLLRVQSGFLAAKQNLGASHPTITLLSSLKEMNFQELKDAPSRGQFIPTIELRDLTFTYPNQTQPTLKSINLKISKGEKIGIVGSTGAGKSTFADLLLGILEPQSGYAKISHVSAPLAPKIWPGKIAYVPQDVVIIDGSVLENITLGHFSNSEKDIEKIWAILAHVQLKNDIEKLELGIETLVGERGAHLSGGQKQRLGIARALYSEPEILILDEATSALDSVTESVLSENLFSRKGTLTLVVIAHRLSTIRHADKIILISDSRISAEGNFEELRANNLEFRNLAELSGL